MLRDLPTLDDDPVPHVPTLDDLTVPLTYPAPVVPPSKPKDGDVVGTPKKIGTMSPTSREAEDRDRNRGLESLLKSHAARQAGQRFGEGFAKLSRGTPADRQRAENMIDAIHSGFANARQRNEITNELAHDDNFLASLGFYGRSSDD